METTKTTTIPCFLSRADAIRSGSPLHGDMVLPVPPGLSAAHLDALASAVGACQRIHVSATTSDGLRAAIDALIADREAAEAAAREAAAKDAAREAALKVETSRAKAVADALDATCPAGQLIPLLSEEWPVVVPADVRVSIVQEQLALAQTRRAGQVIENYNACVDAAIANGTPLPALPSEETKSVLIRYVRYTSLLYSVLSKRADEVAKRLRIEIANALPVALREQYLAGALSTPILVGALMGDVVAAVIVGWPAYEKLDNPRGHHVERDDKPKVTPAAWEKYQRIVKKAAEVVVPADTVIDVCLRRYTMLDAGAYSMGSQLCCVVTASRFGLELIKQIGISE